MSCGIRVFFFTECPLRPPFFLLDGHACAEIRPTHADCPAARLFRRRTEGLQCCQTQAPPIHISDFRCATQQWQHTVSGNMNPIDPGTRRCQVAKARRQRQAQRIMSLDCVRRKRRKDRPAAPCLLVCRVRVLHARSAARPSASVPDASLVLVCRRQLWGRVQIGRAKKAIVGSGAQSKRTTLSRSWRNLTQSPDVGCGKMR